MRSPHTQLCTGTMGELTQAAVMIFGLVCLSAKLKGTATAQEQLIWRFKNYGAHSLELLPCKAQITMECVSHQNTSWTSPTCDISTVSDSNSSSSVVAVRCPWPGFHEVAMSAPSELDNNTVEATVYIPLSYSPYCYEWRATVDSVNANSSSEMWLQVWIDEPGSSGGSTTKSRALTNQYLSLGEHPVVSLVSPSSQLNIAAQGFNSACRKGTLAKDEENVLYETSVTITGADISIIGCTVRPKLHVINFEKFSSSVLVVEVGVEVNISSGTPKVYQDLQSPGIAVILDGGNNFITQDGFSTVHSFQFASLLLAIEEVAFTSTTLCALVDGEVFVLSARSEENITRANGFSVNDTEHVVGKTVPCISTTMTEITVDIVAAWKAEGSVFVSSDGGFTFEEAELLNLAHAIHTVGIHPTSPQLVALVDLGSSQAQFWFYSTDQRTWNSSGFHFLTKGGRLSMQYFPGLFGDLVLWEEGALYYSPNSGSTVTEVQMYTTSNDGALIPHVWEPGVHEISYVTTGTGGQFAVLSTHNRLFYGTTGVGYAIEIQSGLLPSSKCLLWFDAIGQLMTILFSDTITTRKVPTHSLALIATYPPPPCPYYQWNSSITQEIYYLDAGENTRLWASVTPKQWTANQISFMASEPTILDMALENRQYPTAVQGASERNLSVLIKPKAHVSEQSAAVKFSVASQNLACQPPAEVVALVSFSCPPRRHIRVQRPTGSSWCSRFKKFKYKIPKEHYDPMLLGRKKAKGKAHKEVEYDYTLHGCPLKVSYLKSFKPTLELYDGDDFVKVVDADFVMWELHGRTDFGYKADAKQVSCRSTPQTWSEMLSSGLHPSQAWTPKTYRHCFQQSEGDQLNRKTSYQILNYTGVNAIKWGKHNGIYIMVATVVDSDYSYCNLTTIFGVHVSGATTSTFLGYLLLVMTCMIGGGALVGTYFFYRHLMVSGKLDKAE